MEGDFFIRAIANLNASYIYEGAGVLAYWVAGALTGPILFFSVIWRIKGEVLGSVGGGTKWLPVIRDFTIWGIVLALYFSICQVIFGGFNVMYKFADSLGGVEGLMLLFQEYYDKAITFKADRDWVDTVKDVASMPITGGAILLYNVTLLLFTAAKIILSWAQAVAFSSAFYWGLIAIPLSLKAEADNKFIKSWATFFTVTLLWPVIDGFTLWLVSMGFTTMFENMDAQFGSGGSPMMDLASVYNLFSLIHIVLFVFMGASLMICMGLVSSGSVAGLNGMAMGGALAIGAMGYSAMKKGGGMLNRGNLGKADTAVRGFGDASRNALHSVKEGLGSIGERFKKPLPNNGYSFSGGNGGGGSRSPKTSTIAPYLSGENKLQGGSKPVSGYGGLDKSNDAGTRNTTKETPESKGMAPDSRRDKSLQGSNDIKKHDSSNKEKESVGKGDQPKCVTSKQGAKKSKIQMKAKGAISGSYVDQGDGATEETKEPPKRNLNQDQKRARKAYFAKKTRDLKNKGDES